MTNVTNFGGKIVFEEFKGKREISVRKGWNFAIRNSFVILVGARTGMPVGMWKFKIVLC